MAQPDISQILAALAQQGQAGTPQTSAPPQQQAYAQPPAPYASVQSPPLPGFLPQPSNSGSVDLSNIKPTNSGSVSIADAIAKAKSIAADRGVSSYDPRLNAHGGSGNYRSRSRSPSRRDDYSSSSNPYRDERRDDPRRGGRNGYRRSPSPDHRGGGGYGSSNSDVETIRVKSSLVGLIIGRNGENLRKVESDSGARVQFIQPTQPNQQERQCTISGSFRAREDAKQAIFAIIEDNGGSNIMNDKPGSYASGVSAGRAKVNLPALRDGEHTVQMLVPDKTVGLIIGRGGETIKDIQEKSGCHVNIVGENKSINGQRPVNLIGTERATQIARDLILEVVDSDGRGTATVLGAGPGPGPGPGSRDRGYDNYGGGRGGDDAHEEKTIIVPSEAVGMIIGKGGDTIKDLQRTSGCKINVNQPKHPDVTRNIDLAGTRHAIQAAERVIWEKVETVRERDSAAGRGGSGGGRGASGGYDSAPQQSYGNYSQPQQSMPAYGGYPAAQQQQSTPFQMPFFGQQQQSAQQSSTPAAQADGQQAPQINPALYAQYYAQYMAQLANQGQQGGTGQ